MNENDLKIFEEIKKKAEKDNEIWMESQKDDATFSITPEKEEEIMERMFLVHFTNQYLLSLEEIKKLKNKLSETEQQLCEAEGAICCFRED